METNKKTESLEALLFIHGEPISFKKIQSTLEIQDEDLKSAVLELKSQLDSSGGLTLISEEPLETMFENSGWQSKKIQLATKPEFGGILSAFVKDEMGQDLSPATLDVLSIVAYLGPINRAQIEYIRGVNSIFTLRNLMIRGLVERTADPKNPHAFLYAPTLELFKYLGVGSKEELPEFEKFSQLLTQGEQKANANT